VLDIFWTRVAARITLAPDWDLGEKILLDSATHVTHYFIDTGITAMIFNNLNEDTVGTIGDR
jgi:hypothetical protein